MYLKNNIIEKYWKKKKRKKKRGKLLRVIDLFYYINIDAAGSRADELKLYISA